MNSTILLLLSCTLAMGAPVNKKMAKVPPYPPGFVLKKASTAYVPPTTIPPTGPPPLPMTNSVKRVDSDYGTWEHTVAAFQPAGQSLTFKRIAGAITAPPVHLSTWSPHPSNQTAFISFYSWNNFEVVTAEAHVPLTQRFGPSVAPVATIASVSMDGLKMWRIAGSNLTIQATGPATRTSKAMPGAITTQSQFTTRCPYCGKVVVSRSVGRNGATTTATGVVETITISFKCRGCKSTFTDHRTQVVPNVNSVRLPIR